MVSEPTTVTSKRGHEADEGARHLVRFRRSSRETTWLGRWSSGIFSAAGRGESHSDRAAGFGTAGRAYKAGVKIALGTDAGVYPHGQNAHEFELMVQAGMSPLFTIQTATVHAAQLLNATKILGASLRASWLILVAVRGIPR